jgi:hypothetical protein
MLDDGMGFSLVPWRPVIEQRLGQHIAAVVRGGGVSWELGRLSFSGDNCTNQRSLMPAVHPAPDSPISGLPRTKLVYVHYSCASK